MVAAWGVREGHRDRRATASVPRRRKRGAALWAAKWELAMPVVVLVAMFSGLATAVEAAALTALYALVVQTRRSTATCRSGAICCASSPSASTVVGGVLDDSGRRGRPDQLPGQRAGAGDAASSGRAATSTSRFMFLLVLNVFLLVVGWLMDIFAAIVVVVPLIVPLGAAFGIHPVHLGIIFIANLELGYPDAARRPEHLPRLVPIQAAGARGVRGGAADDGDSGRRRAGHHLRAVADHWHSATPRPRAAQALPRRTRTTDGEHNSPSYKEKSVTFVNEGRFRDLRGDAFVRRRGCARRLL